ncbi:MAG: SPFH domain-containing protein [Anaerolineae bacterium]|nr:SPFH domain-containing protein [Anaerolineae bacterium]
MGFITVLRMVAAISWLVVIAAIGFTITRTARGQKTQGSGYMIGLLIAVTVVLNVISAGLFFISASESGVVVTNAAGGVRPEPLESGLKWVIPYWERVEIYPVGRQTYTMSIAHEEGQKSGDDSVEARTADGQVVKVDASVIFEIEVDKVVYVHRKYQHDYLEKLIRPLARGIIRDAVSQFAIEEVYSSKRLIVNNMISDELARKLAEEGFRLSDFVLRNIAFSEEYAAAIEQKQIAEQLAQQAHFVVQQREQEAEQARQVAQGEADAVVIRAEGAAKARVIDATAEAESRLIQAKAEAEALRLLGEAIAENPDVLLLEYIQKLADNITVMLLPSDNPFLLPLPDLGQ